MSHLFRICGSGRIAWFLGAMVVFALPAFSQEIQWIRSFSAGMKLARQNNRPALVDFWSEWCIPCKQMDRDPYADPGLSEASRRFVLIRVDVDKDQATAAHFGIKILPMKLFLDPRESVLREIKGFTKATEILLAGIGEYTPPTLIVDFSITGFAAEIPQGADWDRICPEPAGTSRPSAKSPVLHWHYKITITLL